MAAQPRWGPGAYPDRNPARVLSAIALASIAAGAINLTAAATVGRDSAQNLAFFGVVAAAQVVWGAVAFARAPRWGRQLRRWGRHVGRRLLSSGPPRAATRRRGRLGVRKGRIAAPPSAALVVQVLQQLVGSQLDLLVAPLGRPVVTGDDARPMDPAKVAVHERVACLGPVRRSVRQPEVPCGVLIPGMRLEELVLGVGAGLHLAPVAVQDVLARVDQPLGIGEGALIDAVGGHPQQYRADLLAMPFVQFRLLQALIGSSNRCGVRRAIATLSVRVLALPCRGSVRMSSGSGVSPQVAQ